MPNSFEHSLFNDEIEDMPNILASTFIGNIELIYKLIENTKAFEFARIAAIDSLVALLHMKTIFSREFVIAYFGNLLTNNFNKNKDTELQPWIIHFALDSTQKEIICSIRLAFYFL